MGVSHCAAMSLTPRTRTRGGEVRRPGQAAVWTAHPVPGRVFELVLSEQREGELAADLIRSPVLPMDTRAGNGAFPPASRARSPTSVARLAMPRPWNSGSTDQPVPYICCPCHSRSQNPTEPSAAPVSASTILNIPDPARCSGADASRASSRSPARQDARSSPGRPSAARRARGHLRQMARA